MKRLMIGLFIITMALVFMSCPNPATDQTITLLAIPGVVAPVTGATPITTAIDTVQYTGTIDWSPGDSTFSASTVYTATIVLTAKAGWTLTGVAANSFTVAGATATNAVNAGAVAAVFPATSLSIAMVTVPAGSFNRDATVTNISVITTAYWMSEKEITRAQFTAIMVDDPSDTLYSSGTSDPVQQANWYHAIAFCNKLSIAEGLTPVYSVSGITDWAGLDFSFIPVVSDVNWDAATATWTNSGYRLPTEMEWMWAAMGADTANPGALNATGYGKAFAGSTGSNAIGDYTVFGYYGSETGRTTTERTNPVGSKTTGANELGLYDMSGNVWEWCWDWNADYPAGTLIDNRGAASGTHRLRRGGGWVSDASYCTIAIRFSNGPCNQDVNIGFRVVRP